MRVDVGAQLGQDGEPDVLGPDHEPVVLVVRLHAGVDEAVLGREEPVVPPQVRKRALQELPGRGGRGGGRGGRPLPSPGRCLVRQRVRQERLRRRRRPEFPPRPAPRPVRRRLDGDGHIASLRGRWRWGVVACVVGQQRIAS